jgi:squalene synthase HpnC
VDHYENFPVASWLCPPALRPPILAIYRFARTADDLADEGGASAEKRLADLQIFRETWLSSLQSPLPLEAPWSGVFNTLALQIQRFQLPLGPLHDLLDAFEQDVAYTRDGRGYPNREELLEYCQRSANPIGRLLLHLYRVNDADSLRRSDAICTALQLINFWQDLSVDIPRGRYYMPHNSNLREELRYVTELMNQGASLVHRVPGRMGWELRLVVQGGLCILDKCWRTDTYTTRPVLTWRDSPGMLWQALKM